MELAKVAMTAVYLKLNGEYIGFIEELPAMTCRGRTINEAREALQALAADSFAEARRTSAEAHAGEAVVRETFFIKPG
jgi:hypothetical protein